MTQSISKFYAKQKHLGCKKVWGQSETTLQTGRHNQKEVTLSNICNSLNDTQYYSIFSQV